MARTTTTTYTCDGCGAAVTRKDLRRFFLEERSLGGRCHVIEHTDICTTCEKDVLHPAIKKLFPPEAAEAFDGIVRP